MIVFKSVFMFVQMMQFCLIQLFLIKLNLKRCFQRSHSYTLHVDKLRTLNKNNKAQMGGILRISLEQAEAHFESLLLYFGNGSHDRLFEIVTR